MAVYKNYYNHRWSSWAMVFTCLYLLCSTISSSCSLVGGERLRHHRKLNEEVVPDQLENSAIEESSKHPIIGCPDCQAAAAANAATADMGAAVKLETDLLRLEAIKRQILSKLGLRQKPNVTYSLPRQLILDTIGRAADSGYDNQPDSTTSARTAPMEAVDYDDFYGRTSEIISFAEPGSWVNQNRLLEFRVSRESGQLGQEFRVRAASLWLKADRRSHPTADCRTQIYVFKIISSRLPESVTVVTKQFQRMTLEPVVENLDESPSGWQKINLTDTVRTWLTETGKDKLQLFVDCSCCTNWHIHLFNNEIEKPSNRNRPFLVIHTDPNTAKRVRRRALDCSPDSGNQCCKQRFYVNFKSLGWDDWVIAPQGYFANYCRGDCGHHRTPDTFESYHSHVIEEVRKTQHLSGMQPCCAPLKFSSMSLIYHGPDRNIIKRDLPKMVVDECGCP